MQVGNILVKMKLVIRYALRRKPITSNALMLAEINDIGICPDDEERFLNDDEIDALWNAIDKTKMSWQNKMLIRIVALTDSRWC
ncbi:hypothetical protein OGY18_01665 [Citrobacter sp. Cpo142]|uniref:hypothetical protein n=1 Tax=Citrobacter TaxID=544 RepID=UPI00257903DD|nr:hypothetical protein [Citrobacter sp. Cpo142]MDM2775872.1 hypothetical protein [Citrobacter sp. Cpo142]